MSDAPKHIVKPLAIDLYAGLGGWSEGLLAAGYDVVGFDIERHEYGAHRYPATLVIQDVLTLHGRQFKDATLIVASPPCQAYSYRAMPWSRAKALPPPDNTLFEACFRIQHEASEAAGRRIPRGGTSAAFYLWGDVPALIPFASKSVRVGGISFSGYGTPDYKGVAFNGTAQKRLAEGVKAAPDGLGSYGGGFGWDGSPMRRGNSKSSSRKAASALIAKIPLPLSTHIAEVFRP